TITNATVLDLLSGALDAHRHPELVHRGSPLMADNTPSTRRYSRRQVLTAGATGVVGIGAIGVAAYLVEQGTGAPAASPAPAGPGSIAAASASPQTVAVASEASTSREEATPTPATTQGTTGARTVFHSRPDLTPPVISIVTAATESVAPGLIFYTPGDGVAPDGP